jgi:hypothetical protein
MLVKDDLGTAAYPGNDPRSRNGNQVKRLRECGLGAKGFSALAN